jgi:replication factor A1
MGAIEDIYADLETDVSEAEFREAVEQKVDQMEGLADEETAAMIIAHELADNEVETIADVEPAMDEVKFIAKVRSIGDLRTFEREDGEGRVANVEVADESDSIWLSFWDEQAEEVVEGQLAVGDVLRIKGRPRDGYNGLEVSVERAEPEPDVDIDVDLGGDSTIDSLSMGQSDVNVRGVVLDTDTIRTFDRDDGSEGRVSNITLGDETDRIRVTLWDERADRATELETGTAVEIVDGYVREREGDLELHVGEHGAIDEIDDAVEYDPDATPIGTVEIEQTVDIAGVVRSTDPKRTFDRDDGSEGQVRNVRVQDDSGDIRVALWGEKADLDVAPGDEILVADAEIQDGWQDELEASAGWQSAVVVLEDDSIDLHTTAGEDGAGRSGQSSTDGSPTGSEAGRQDSADDSAVSDGGNATGLDAFEDGSAPETSSTESAEGDTVEFTGTVVQTGEPVVLDDGTETMSVETDATLRLGEEVTARGELVEDRLDAEEIL